MRSSNILEVLVNYNWRKRLY